MWGRKVKGVELEKKTPGPITDQEIYKWSIEVDGLIALIKRNDIIWGLFRFYDVFWVLYKPDRDKTVIHFYNNNDWLEIPGNCAPAIHKGMVGKNV